ncbi:unnamed protein product, partial [Laminaria digitata]
MIFLRSFIPAVLVTFVVFSTPVAAQTNVFADDPLIVAVYEDRTDKVRALIVRQHPMARVDSDGRTPLIFGAIQGSDDSIALLLE